MLYSWEYTSVVSPQAPVQKLLQPVINPTTRNPSIQHRSKILSLTPASSVKISKKFDS